MHAAIPPVITIFSQFMDVILRAPRLHRMKRARDAASAVSAAYCNPSCRRIDQRIWGTEALGSMAFRHLVATNARGIAANTSAPARRQRTQPAAPSNRETRRTGFAGSD